MIEGIPIERLEFIAQSGLWGFATMFALTVAIMITFAKHRVKWYIVAPAGLVLFSMTYGLLIGSITLYNMLPVG